MKKFLKIILGIVLVIGTIIGVVFYFTSGMVDKADQFFVAASEGRMDEAETFLSDGFKLATPRDRLVDFLTNSTLREYQSGSWSSRSISGSTARLEGTVTTRSGGAVPITIEFVKELGEWKILSIKRKPAGISSPSVQVEVPSPEKQLALIKNTIALFALGINDRDFSELISSSSIDFQQKYSPEQLKQSFSSWIDQTIDLSVLNKLRPEQTAEPAIDSNGILSLKGKYPTEPSLFTYNLSYTYEGNDWKMVGLKANLN